MSEHETCEGASNDWYTPREYFAAIGLTFALDPCSPGPGHWVPAQKIYTIADDGLSRPWRGLVFMNPPFGGRFGQVPWLEKFFEHANGIALVRAYTSSSWWHDLMPCAHGILFPRGKTRFIRGAAMTTVRRTTGESIHHEAGSEGKSPGHGVALVGMGLIACDALKASGLGMFWDVRSQRDISGCKNWAGQCQVNCGENYCMPQPGALVERGEQP